MITILIPSREEENIVKMIMAVEEYFPHAQIIVANDRYGKGKGWAVRLALAEARFPIVCLIDGDMDIHPRMIFRLLPFIDDFDIVLGRKLILGPFHRRLITKLSRFLIWLLFGLTYDTQTGIKLFHRHALLPWKSDGFMFDVEVLANARRLDLRMVEVQVDVTRSKSVKLKSVWRCLCELVRIRLQVP